MKVKNFRSGVALYNSVDCSTPIENESVTKLIIIYSLWRKYEHKASNDEKRILLKKFMHI